MSEFGELPSNNLAVYAVKSRNFCRHLPAIWRRCWRFEKDWARQLCLYKNTLYIISVSGEIRRQRTTFHIVLRLVVYITSLRYSKITLQNNMHK